LKREIIRFKEFTSITAVNTTSLDLHVVCAPSGKDPKSFSGNISTTWLPIEKFKELANFFQKVALFIYSTILDLLESKINKILKSRILDIILLLLKKRNNFRENIK